MGVEGAEEFRRAAARLRDADKTVLGELAKAMRASAKPIVSAIRDEVHKEPAKSASKGSGGSAAAVERQLHTLARAGRQLKPLTERQSRALVRRVERMTSLRENIAAATGSTLSTKPGSVNLMFRVRSSSMPPSQRKLPKRWNLSGGWKHPVYGNRKTWVKQYGRPYFDKTIGEHVEEVRTGVTEAVKTAAEKIVHGEAP